MALYGDATYEGRLQREVSSLVAAGHRVTVGCLKADRLAIPDFDGKVQFIVEQPSTSSVLPGMSPFLNGASRGRISELRDRALWLIGYIRNLRAWGALIVGRMGPVDVWQAHDLVALAAISGSIGSSTPLIYDVHDLFMATGTGRLLPAPLRALVHRYERRLVRRCFAVLSVSGPMAAQLEAWYQPRRLTIVHNCPPRWRPPLDPPDLIRAATGIPRGDPVVLYHGALYPNRGMEQLCEALLEPGLDQVHVVLLGFGERRAIIAEFAREPRFGGRVHLLNAVPPNDLLPWVASADVGTALFQPSTLNHILTIPNKLFQCIGAGTPVVASDFPGNRSVVLGDPSRPLGVVCNSTSSSEIAAAIRSILQLSPTDRAAFRERCLVAAHERWNWETEVRGLMTIYDQVAEASGSAAEL